jgi:hypothetical protein
MTDEEAVKIITLALAALPQQSARMTADNIANAAQVWAELMPDHDREEVWSAVKRLLVTSKWLPTPAEILAVIDAARHGRRPGGAEQWSRVCDAIGAVGRFRPAPAFRDPVTARVVDALGWRELCESENQVADRARFIELYDRLATEAVEDRAVAEVPGIARPALTGPRGRVGEMHRLDVSAFPGLPPAKEGN